MQANIYPKSHKWKVYPILALLLLFSLQSCNDDPISGWALYQSSPPPPKIVSLHSSIKNCVPPYPVTFYQVTENKLGNIAFFWDFGDENTSTAQNPNHIYAEPGDYTITLIVSNEIGADTIYYHIPELKEESIPVNVDFSFSHYNDNIFAPNRVFFENHSSGANQFFWEFGDGNEDNNDNPIHVFEQANNYTVSMRGTCTDGSYDEASKPIFVSPPPQRIFIDSLNLMLPQGSRSGRIFVELVHNTTYVGSTVSYSGSDFPVKFRTPNDFFDRYFFDQVQYSANEAFKFVILKENGENPPIFLYEILLSSADIQNRFYPRTYFQIEHIPTINDLFIDLYLSY